MDWTDYIRSAPVDRSVDRLRVYTEERLDGVWIVSTKSFKTNGNKQTRTSTIRIYTTCGVPDLHEKIYILRHWYLYHCQTDTNVWLSGMIIKYYYYRS